MPLKFPLNRLQVISAFIFPANESKVVFEFPGKSTREAPPQIAALGFTGRSFVQFPAPENAYLETNISIEFRSISRLVWPTVLFDLIMFLCGE